MNGNTLPRRSVLTALLSGTIALSGCAGLNPLKTGGSGLTVEAEDRRVDRPIPLRITGADPGAEVTVTVTDTDIEGRTWTFEETFAANDEGVVDLASDGPGADTRGDRPAMGWITGMTPEDGSGARYVAPRAERVSMTVKAKTTDDEASERLSRPKYAEGVTDREVDNPDVVGRLYEPPGEGPHPGVLVLHGSGGQPLIRWAWTLASNGYAAAALQYFGDPEPIPDVHSKVPLEYFDKAAEWLRDQSGVGDGSVGLVGVSRGGELALLLGARREWPGAVVSYVGSGIRFQSYIGSDYPPAWTDGGQVLPSLAPKGTRELSEEGYYRFRNLYVRAVEAASEEELEAATISVEETGAPILCISGGDDQLWPSQRLSKVAMERLREAGVDHHFEHRTYEDAGHAIDTPYRPTAGRRVIGKRLFGGTPEGYARADVGSWPAVLSTLERGLR